MFTACAVARCRARGQAGGAYAGGRDAAVTGRASIGADSLPVFVSSAGLAVPAPPAGPARSQRWLLVVIAASDCAGCAAVRLVLDGVFDFACGLIGVAGGLFGASLGPEPTVPGHAAGALLASPFAVWALCLIFLRMFMVLPFPGFSVWRGAAGGGCMTATSVFAGI